MHFNQLHRSAQQLTNPYSNNENNQNTKITQENKYLKNSVSAYELLDRLS